MIVGSLVDQELVFQLPSQINQRLFHAEDVLEIVFELRISVQVNIHLENARWVRLVDLAVNIEAVLVHYVVLQVFFIILILILITNLIIYGCYFSNVFSIQYRLFDKFRGGRSGISTRACGR